MPISGLGIAKINKPIKLSAHFTCFIKVICLERCGMATLKRCRRGNPGYAPLVRHHLETCILIPWTKASPA